MESRLKDFPCNRDLTACVPRDYRAQYCIDSSRSSCEANGLHCHSIHPSAHLIRERCVSQSAIKKKRPLIRCTNRLVQKISVRRFLLLGQIFTFVFFLSLSYDKPHLKKVPILSPVLSAFYRVFVGFLSLSS